MADSIREIADAVLYEGYILWPYRRSALKNQRRFTFGGVYPPAHCAAHPDDRDEMQTEVLVRGVPETQLTVTARFLHVVRRAVARRCGDRLEDVDELIVDGTRHLAWEEAVEREFNMGGSLEQLRARQRAAISIPAGSDEEEIAEAGAFIRSWSRLDGELAVEARALAPGLWRLAARVTNIIASAPRSREEALEQTLCSTHLLLHVTGGEFVSLTDPPSELTEAAAECHNIGTWPVLVGEPGRRDTMLSSPIILEEYPRVAPESPGDLFDGGEIDQLLILNILALTDEERAEMAASDPRARAILERCQALSPDEMMALHGTIRELGMSR